MKIAVSLRPFKGIEKWHVWEPADALEVLVPKCHIIASESLEQFSQTIQYSSSAAAQEVENASGSVMAEVPFSFAPSTDNRVEELTESKPVREFLQKVFRPVEYPEVRSFQNRHVIAVHFRDPARYDGQWHEDFPLKFSDKEQTAKLLQDELLGCHNAAVIFCTDSPKAEALLSYFRKEACGAEFFHESNATLERDLVRMSKADVLIGVDSSVAKVAAIMGNHKKVITATMRAGERCVETVTFT